MMTTHTIGWDPARTATGWKSARGPLPHLPTAADATQCATCNEQGRIWEHDGHHWTWEWCEACCGTGRA